jgi:DNA-binding response OmpR family regulator
MGEHIVNGDSDNQIVVIDDDRAVGDLIGRMLEHAGFNVLVTMSGTSALKLCESRTPALVITDIVMPGMEGIEFLRRLRKIRSGIPVIAISGHPVGTGFLRAAELLGARGVLSKPFNQAALLAVVNTVLGGPQDGPHVLAISAPAERVPV